MKRILILLLAVVLLAPITPVTYAASQVREQTPTTNDSQLSPQAVYLIEAAGYLADESNLVVIDMGEGDGDESIDKLAPGETVYYKLKTKNNMPVTSQSAVSGVAITQDWSVGSGLISKVEIVQMKYKDRSEVDYCYMLAITAKAGGVSASLQDAAGTITLKKTSGTDSSAPSGGNSLSFTLGIRFFFEIGYESGNSTEISAKAKVYDPDGLRETILFTFDDCPEVNFEVDVTGQNALIVAADSKADSTITNRYPSATLSFFNGNGATFNKWGRLIISAAPGSYLYEVSGSTLKLSNVSYSSDVGGFEIETKTLGRYVVSDRVLSSAAETSTSSSNNSSSDTSVYEPDGFTSTTEYPSSVIEYDYGIGKINPGTGAVA